MLKIVRREAVRLIMAAMVGVSSWSCLHGQEAPTGDYRIPNGCLITSLDEPLVSAAKAGRLMEVPREGDEFREGDVLGQVDDREALLAVSAAQFEYDIAMKQATNDVDLRYADKQAELTAEELQQAVEAREAVDRSISDSEFRQRKFTHERSILAREQAQRDQIVARLTAKVKEANLQAAQAEVENRKVRSPIDGTASEVLRQRGEWVNPGDPIVKMLRMNRLKVEGFVENARYRPFEINGKPVTVEVRLGGDEVHRLEGTITFVSPDIGANGEYRVSAEIDNPELPQGGYMVNPGMVADMVIHVR